MTLRIDAKVLLEALRKAGAAVEPYKLYEVLQCVRLEASDGRCTLTSFNLEHEIAIHFPVEGEVEPFLVNSSLLTGWLTKAARRTDVVTAALTDIGSVWQAGRASASLPRLDIKGWSGFGAFEPDRSCVCSGSALAEAMNAALAAVQDDPSRPYLSGVRLEAGSVASASAPGRMVAVGTNGVMLVARDIPVTGLAGQGEGIILPIVTVKALSKLLAGVDTATLSWNDKRVLLEVGDTRFQATLIEGYFPERWRQSAGASRTPHVTYDSRDLIGAVESITTLAPEEGERRFRGVTMTLGDSETALTCADNMKGISGEDRCPHSLIDAPPKSTVALAANQLLKIIGALDGETIQMSIGDGAGLPVVLSVAAKDDRLAFAVPLRTAA